MNRLIKSLPDYERKSRLLNEIVHAASVELEGLDEQNKQNREELFIDTAVKALQIHAKDLGITLGVGLTVKQQRELISAHYRASFEQTTEETIKNIAAAFSNGEVDINTTDTAGVYEIKFVGSIGVPDNVEGLKATIATIVPAHLMFVYAYTFNTWSMIAHLTWKEASNFTWNQLRNEVLE